MKTISAIRPSPIAGTWYDSNPERLSEQLNRYLDQVAIPSLDGEVLGLVSPHAGYRYSGPTAAYAFKTVVGKKYDLVAVLSPLHDYLPGSVITSAHQAYATPLGKVPIATEEVKALDDALFRATETHPVFIHDDHEHALEIELPFLQLTLAAPFRLIPLMLRELSPSYLKQLGMALAQVLKGKNVLLVASSDLSHFYPEEQANRMDERMLEQVGNFSPDGVLKEELMGTSFACGAPAIATVLWATRELGANRVHVLHHSTSGNETGDHTSVVGYGAAVILKQP